MRPSPTANDDQPGPTGRRHISFGGDADQSVSIRMPGTTLSRWGPRNPGQSMCEFAASAISASAALGTTGDVLGAAGVSAGVAGTGTAAGTATGSLPARANNSSSEVCFQRQLICGRPPPVTPPVRTSAQNPQASRIATTSARRPGPVPRERLTTAQTTSARHRPGTTKITNIRPTDEWRSPGIRGATATATMMRSTALQRSAYGTRLKNAHHSTTTNPNRNPPANPNGAASGAMIGTPIQASHCSIRAATPGHNRRGFLEGVFAFESIVPFLRHTLQRFGRFFQLGKPAFSIAVTVGCNIC